MLAPFPVFAQETTDPADTARFRFGPLRFTPSILISDLGIDNNVFNEQDARKDRTAAVGPAVNLWMNVGGSRLSGSAAGQYLYFKTYENQRSWNTQNDLRWDVPLGRIAPYIAGTYANTKARPGFEIDSRVRQESQSVELGSLVKLGRATLTLAGRRAHANYQDDATFDGSDLGTALNQAANVEQLALRYRLTSLTTFVVDTQALQDRFAGDPLRNSNSIKVQPGFEMKAAALVAGKVFVGVRRFAPLNPLVPAYTGPTVSADATMTARATQVNFRMSRDVAFSYRETQPYYLLTDAGLSITQRLSDAWDVVVRGGRSRLDYAQLVPPSSLPGVPGDVLDGGVGSPLAEPAPPQVDTVDQYGGGVGLRFGRVLRLGLDANYYRRRSTDPLFREYHGLRAGASVRYGLSQ